MELAVYTTEGKDTGRKVTLNDEIFGMETNDHVIYLDIKQHLANKRQGTAHAKERSEVSYSTRKIKKQKGTGGARAGDIKSPVFVGGGTIFGPKPRDYSFKLNKKVKQLARVSALVYKLKEDNLKVVEDIAFDAPKTKELIRINNNLQIGNKKVLYVSAEQNINLYLSSRNLQRVNVATLSELNTYSIMNAAVLVFTESSAVALQESANQ